MKFLVEFPMEERTHPRKPMGTEYRGRKGKKGTEICPAAHPHQRICASGTSTETGCTPMMVGTSVGVSQNTRHGRRGGVI